MTCHSLITELHAEPWGQFSCLLPLLLALLKFTTPGGDSGVSKGPRSLLATKKVRVELTVFHSDQREERNLQSTGVPLTASVEGHRCDCGRGPVPITEDSLLKHFPCQRYTRPVCLALHRHFWISFSVSALVKDFVVRVAPPPCLGSGFDQLSIQTREPRSPGLVYCSVLVRSMTSIRSSENGLPCL